LIYKCFELEKIAPMVKFNFAVLPADTLYALSINIYSDKSKDIYTIKGRSESIPVPVGVKDINMLEEIAEPVDFVYKILKEDWSYLITIVLKNKKVPKYIAGDTVGIRIPKNEQIKKIMEYAGPITLTSANLHGGKNPVTVLDSYEQLKDKVDIYLDCGPCSGIPSTVIDLTGKTPRLIREGAIPFNRVISLYESK